MEFKLEDLLRPNILRMKPYSSARDEFSGTEGIFLDANENAFGSVGLTENYNRYPDPLQRALKQKIAAQENIQTNQIFLGNGSDEAIDLIIRAFCEPRQDQIMTLPPTYGMYAVSADLNDVGIVEVPLLADFQLDVQGILSKATAQTKILFICSPNNPTGNLMRKQDVIQLLEKFPGIVLLDEAYADFAPNSGLLHLIDQYMNLMIIRTFSKAWGLAGLRLGMAFAQAKVIEVFNKIKPPYNINLLTQEVALKAIEKPELKSQMVAQILQEKEFLKKELDKLTEVQEIYPSDTNFLLIKFNDAQTMYDYLIDKMVIVRNRSKVLLCDECLRITVGTREENIRLLEAIQRYAP